MYQRFKWTPVSFRRNGISAEYEPLQPFFLLALARNAESRTFVDVGANIGNYTLFASQIPSVTRIIAYEANDDAADQLVENLKLNDKTAEVRRVAVSERSGELQFGVVSRFAGNNAIVSTADHNGFRHTKEVKAVTLDCDCADVEGPLCIKVDVEGHEEAVLSGAARLLSSHQSVLQVENYGNNLAHKLADLGYFQLARIGPDSYFTNIEALRGRSTELFEEASAAMIESNHEHKAVTLQKGDFGIQITGTSYERIKKVAQKVLGGRL